MEVITPDLRTPGEEPKPDGWDALAGGKDYYTATWGCFHSVVVQTWDELGKGYNDFTVLCFDLRTGEQLDTLQLLTRLGVDNKFEFIGKTKAEIEAGWDRWMPPSDSPELEAYRQENLRWSLEEVGFDPAFVTEDGRLAVVVKIGGPYVPGRGHQYAVVFPEIELREPVPELKEEYELTDTPTLENEIESVIALAEDNVEGFHVWANSWTSSHYRDIWALVVYDMPEFDNPDEDDVYRVYLYNSAEEELYDTARLLEYLGIAKDTFLEVSRKAVLQYFDAYCTDGNSIDAASWDSLCMDEVRAWTEKQVSLDMPAYVTDEGQLCIIAKIGMPSGRGYFYEQLQPIYPKG